MSNLFWYIEICVWELYCPVEYRSKLSAINNGHLDRICSISWPSEVAKNTSTWRWTDQDITQEIRKHYIRHCAPPHPPPAPFPQHILVDLPRREGARGKPLMGTNSNWPGGDWPVLEIVTVAQNKVEWRVRTVALQFILHREWKGLMHCYEDHLCS